MIFSPLHRVLGAKVHLHRLLEVLWLEKLRGGDAVIGGHCGSGGRDSAVSTATEGGEALLVGDEVLRVLGAGAPAVMSSLC